MEVSLISIMAIGLILGIKHALEPDHIIAVSTLASRSKKLLRSSLAGVYWGIGHTATLFIVGMVFIVMKNEIPLSISLSLEFLVGVMLVYLGMSSFFSIHAKHPRGHNLGRPVMASESGQAYPKAFYLQSMLIGLVHGLAGSGAMILLTMSTVRSTWEGAFYILVFGLGTVIGMLFFTTMLGIPFVLSTTNVSIHTLFTRFTGGISTVYGMYYIYNLGVTEGLFAIWLS